MFNRHKRWCDHSRHSGQGDKRNFWADFDADDIISRARGSTRSWLRRTNKNYPSVHCWTDCIRFAYRYQKEQQNHEMIVWNFHVEDLKSYRETSFAYILGVKKQENWGLTYFLLLSQDRLFSLLLQSIPTAVPLCLGTLSSRSLSSLPILYLVNISCLFSSHLFLGVPTAHKFCLWFRNNKPGKLRSNIPCKCIRYNDFCDLDFVMLILLVL